VATDLLFRGSALGINVVLDVALLLAAGALTAGPTRLRRIDRLDAWLGPVALVVAAFAAVRADPALVAVDVLGAAILGGAVLATMGGRRLMRAATGARLGAYVIDAVLGGTVTSVLLLVVCLPLLGGLIGTAINNPDSLENLSTLISTR